MTAKKGERRKAIRPRREPASGPTRLAAARHPAAVARSQKRRFLFSAGAIVVSALVLRVYQLGAQELWLDEAFSFFMATTPDVVGGLLMRSTPPLYYLLLQGWVVIAGQSEAAVRLLSAITGTFFVAAVIWAGREILDARVGLWSGAIAAVAPIHIYYSQEARAYVLLILALLLTYGALWRAFETNAWPWWALASAGTLAALYTHYLAILGLAPTIFLLLVWPERSRWRRYLGALLGSGLLFLPWIVWSLGLTRRTVIGTSWIQEAWELTPPALAIPLSLEMFGLGGQIGLPPIRLKQLTALEFPGALRFLGVAILFLLGLWVAAPWGDQHVGVPGLPKRKFWLGLLLFFPLGVLWLGSLYKPLYVVGRYDIVAFPAYPLLLGLALSKLQWVKPAGAVLAPIVALLLLIPVGAKLFLYYQAPSTGAARETARVLHDEVADGDVVVFTGLRGLPTLYTLHRLGYQWRDGYCTNSGTGRRFACRMFPRETEQRPATINPSRDLKSADAVREDVQEFMGGLRSEGGSLWVVFGRGRLSEGRLIHHGVDNLLVQELTRVGMKSLVNQGAPAVFQFRRP